MVRGRDKIGMVRGRGKIGMVEYKVVKSVRVVVSQVSRR